MKQSTIAKRVALAGTGLHGGALTRLELAPAAEGTGIVFVRRGMGEGGRDVEIRADVDRLVCGQRATTLAGDGAGAGQGSHAPEVRVRTVEHLLAALVAIGIDNLRIEMDGEEVPAFDGSASPLLAAIDAAGRVEQLLERPSCRLLDEIVVRDGDRSIRALPASGLRISYAIDFPHPAIGRQAFELPRLDRATFADELAGARTFGFLHEVDALRSAGLASGGGLDNAIVLDDHRVLNEGGLRFPDEFVRHKVVDLIGDLALLGMPLEAHVIVERGGHSLHHRLVTALAERLREGRGRGASSASAEEWPLAAAVGRPRRGPV